ncbi:transcription intermediary factor 1-beta-like [Mytilus edulis]|uniref:transcription intermediary factor 1-beta-like n=1 Tax=Mytilus edulis TaxID=6550 RepID=UPI0039F0C59C
MASSKPIPCGPCEEGKVNTKADIWCYNCNEGLCSTCSGQHKKFKGTLDHKTIDIKSFKPSIQTIKTECDKHGQQLNLYCPSHLMPCCDECISTNHSKCTGIKSLANVVEKTKIDQSKQTLEKQINAINHFLEKLVTNKSKNIARGEREYESIQDIIVKIRQEINSHLTRLEKKLCNEAETILNQVKSEASDLITEIKGKQKILKKMQDHLQTVIPHTSNLQSFLGVHQIEQQIHQCQRYVDDLENDERAKEFNIKMKQNDEIENILSKLESLESLGEVMVDRTETALNRETSVRRKAQVESREQSNIKDMTMNIETKIEINIKEYISDMICLMDGRVIVVE